MCCSGGGGDFPTPDEIGRAGARYNRIDQNTPWGSLTYSGTDRNTATQQLSPEMLALQNQMMGVRGAALARLLSRFGGTPTNIQNPTIPETGWSDLDDPKDPFIQTEEELEGSTLFMDPDKGTTDGRMVISGEDEGLVPMSKLPMGEIAPVGNNLPIPGYVPGYDGEDGYVTRGYGDIGLPYDLGIDSMPSYEEDRARYEQAYMDRARGLLDPVFQEQQATLDQVLANRGLPTGTEETEILQGRLGRERADAYTKASLDAILAGGNEVRANRGMTLGERLAQFGTASQARSQMFGEDTTEYNQIASILGLTPTQGAGGGMGNFFSPGMVDMNGAYGLYQQNQQFGQQMNSDFWGGLMALGGQLGAAAISDVNLKTDIHPIDVDEVLEKFGDLEVSSWKYKHEGDEAQVRIGPMAQDFNALFGTPSEARRVGFETIDMISAVGVLLASVKSLKQRVEELEERQS